MIVERARLKGRKSPFSLVKALPAPRKSVSQLVKGQGKLRLLSSSIRKNAAFFSYVFIMIAPSFRVVFLMGSLHCFFGVVNGVGKILVACLKAFLVKKVDKLFLQCYNV